MKGLIVSSLTVILLNNCSSTKQGRMFLDSSTHKDELPEWTTGNLRWEKDGAISMRVQHTVRGDERVSGCLDLAKLDLKEALLSEISNEIKGVLDNAQQSISENAEEVLSKVRSGDFAGKLSGLKMVNQYYERYKIGDVERVDCHVLGEILLSDYNDAKRAILNNL